LEDWRAKALQYFPDLQEMIQNQTTPMGLWIDLSFVLEATYEEQPINEERIRSVYDYAAWCFAQPQTKDVETDLSSAAAVCFVENIPLNHFTSEDLHRWMSVESFEGFENLFRYHLSAAEFQKFSDDFRRKRKQFGGESRV
jgi:hypothetical protein